MWTSRFFVLVVACSWACSSGSKSSQGSGASSNGGSANGTGNGGSANGTGNGGSANGTGSGGSANSTGNGGSANGTGASFCILGFKGCMCDSGNTCAAGLVCTNNTCCDASSGDCSAPPIDSGGDCTGNGGGGPIAAGGSSGAGSCVPGTVGPVLTDCGYPYASSNPRTSIVFNESEVLRGITPSGGAPLASIRLFYNDEHALTLGVRSVTVTTASGDTTTDYPVTPLVNNPDHASYPQTGTNAVSGDQSGLDPSGRPMWPALFITDTTGNPNNRSGDWQQCGTPYNPNAIFGTWKAAARTVDTTVTPNDVSITPDADPAKNNWDLGGGDAVPTGLKNEGFGAEARWDLVLIPGHSYRIQVMVHDGDQNKVGGDSGEACVDFCADSSCPDGNAPCDANGACVAVGAVCVAGCCLLPG
jgi:hypothetical protein